MMRGQRQNCHGQWTFLKKKDYYIKDLYIKNHTKVITDMILRKRDKLLVTHSNLHPTNQQIMPLNSMKELVEENGALQSKH